MKRFLYLRSTVSCSQMLIYITPSLKPLDTVFYRSSSTQYTELTSQIQVHVYNNISFGGEIGLPM